jgi:cystathionine beta-lyase/cystathionine gamma-synthase
VEFETTALHAGERPEKLYGAISVPIYQTSTFEFEDIGKTRGFDYTRSGNPTRKALEDTLAALEGGSFAVAFASGMAAESTLMHLLAPGDRILAQKDLYGGSYRLLAAVLKPWGIETDFVDLYNLGEVERAVSPNTRMVWIESISNPLLGVPDIPGIVQIAKDHGLLSVVDNTFASPVFCNPLELGADIVVHSTTKYINGHSDVIGGAIVTKDPRLAERIGYFANALGTTQAPFDSWLVLRVLDTLGLRTRCHEANALQAARFLETHPAVERVYYPGLETHPSHAQAKRLLKGFGGVVSFVAKCGQEGAFRFLRRVRLIKLAGSLGGTHSLAQHPATMSHATIPQDVRRAAGIEEGLVRLSVGLEHSKDLLADLQEALKA